jgi:HD superfamily phosphohydrolase YqeK
MNLEGDYLEAKTLSERIAAEFPPPRFYVEKSREVALSQELFLAHPAVQAALQVILEREDRLGHGISHVRKVAVDAGALVFIENGDSHQAERLVFLAHLAGVLHDIKREERDHAQRGAEEAERVLSAFDITPPESRAVVQAIRNHEAFKPAEPLDDPSYQLLSDALYDADKFRWGPDNFTDTLWFMVAPRKVPLDTLLQHFIPGLKGIERIARTFRSATGKAYGPDFISLGLEIGRRIYDELKAGR